MEYGLILRQRATILASEKTVLILVVMEYGLGRSVLKPRLKTAQS